MSNNTVGDNPAGQPKSATLAEALCYFQARMPEVIRTKEGDTGGHKYTYADLAPITKLANPILTECGLSFASKPTLLFNDEHPEIPPRFVLMYALRHVSGETDSGMYPLPVNVGPQAIGSAITYGKRQCFCAVLNIATQYDDDAAAAEAGLRQQAREASAPRQGGQGSGKLRSSQPSGSQEDKAPEAGTDSENKLAQELANLAVKLTETDGKTVADLHEQVYKQAQSRRILRAQVKDPVTGERSQLTGVISRAKARMEAAAAEKAAQS